MKTRLIINPAYQELEDFIRNLPETFDIDGDTIQNKRNIIKQIKVGQHLLNVKRFRKPILINRIIYTYFRKSKSYRAYYNALKLIEKGIDTPYPIALIQQYTNSLLGLSFFVSNQLTDVKEVRIFHSATVKGNEEFFTSFAQYTAKLHEAGILHLDYSPGNILFSENEKKYHFSLVDINRMHFQKINIKTGCQNFSRLFGSDEIYIFLAKEYAKARNFDTNTCIKYFLMYKQKFEKKKIRKKKIKHFFGKS